MGFFRQEYIYLYRYRYIYLDICTYISRYIYLYTHISHIFFYQLKNRLGWGTSLVVQWLRLPLPEGAGQEAMIPHTSWPKNPKNIKQKQYCNKFNKDFKNDSLQKILKKKNLEGMRVPCMCLIVQSCLTLCDPMDCSPPGSSVHGDSPGKNTGVDCHALLFPCIIPLKIYVPLNLTMWNKLQSFNENY